MNGPCYATRVGDVRGSGSGGGSGRGMARGSGSGSGQGSRQTSSLSYPTLLLHTDIHTTHYKPGDAGQGIPNRVWVGCRPRVCLR